MSSSFAFKLNQPTRGLFVRGSLNEQSFGLPNKMIPVKSASILGPLQVSKPVDTGSKFHVLKPRRNVHSMFNDFTYIVLNLHRNSFKFANFMETKAPNNSRS